MVKRGNDLSGKIHVAMDECAVHVDNDLVLKEFMGMNLTRGLVLAKQIKKKYLIKFGKPLKITTMSLAVELVSHYAVQEICLWMKGKHLLVPFCRKVIRSTEVIDCGELHCDNNRFVWDLLAIPIGILYRQ